MVKRYTYLGHFIVAHNDHQFAPANGSWRVFCETCSVSYAISKLIEVMAANNFQHVIADGQEIKEI